MKLAAVAAVLFAALATASPLNAALDAPLDGLLDTRQVAGDKMLATPSFIVFNFTAVCAMHKNQCLYDFDMWEHGNVADVPPPGKHCQALVATDNAADQTLPAVPVTRCWFTSTTFSISRQPDGGLNITGSVQVDPLSYKTGSHIIPPGDLRTYPDVFDHAQRYVGDKDFELWDTVQ